MSDPQIPAALAPAIVGVVSLNDFTPRPNLVRRPKTEYTVGRRRPYAVTPPDLATIYNFNPLFSAGQHRPGSNHLSDRGHRSLLNRRLDHFPLDVRPVGLYWRVVEHVHPAPPSGTNNCTDPGVNGDDGEAILDAE